jgi:4-amino-4-deoxy-L-arabinose transferase-like glycosyltransferase
MRLARASLIIVLLLAGAILAVHLEVAEPRTRSASLTIWTALAAAAAGAIPPIANRILALVGRISGLSSSTRRRVTIGVWVVATLYLAETAWVHARDLFPRLHDEQSYTIGARMLAHGRLWAPRHPLADFFESFHIFVRPVYSSIYFPGTAILNVPGIWLSLPSWVVPVLAAGLVVALAYRVTAELADDASGLLAALMVISVRRFRVLSTMVMAQVPSALLGLLLLWAWLRWRRDRRPRWALLIGAFAGWAAVTRPVDAIAFALPVALAMLGRSWPFTLSPTFPGAMGKRTGLPVGQPIAPQAHAQPGLLGHGTRATSDNGRGLLIRSAIALLAGAMPFLILQLIFDVGVTGRAFKTPYVQYLNQNQPGSTLGSVPSGQAALPETALPQKRAYFYWLVQDEQANRRSGWEHWLGQRLALTIANGLPNVIFLLLLPVGLVGLNRQRWVVAASIPLFFALYLFNPFYLPHYPVPLIAPLAFLAAVGVHGVLTWAREPVASPMPANGLRWRNMAASSLLLGCAALCVGSLPELNPAISDEAYALPTVTLAEGPLRDAVQAPAVILFRYRPGLSPDDEPVYNSDVVWPDDAPIIRAHDLGERNAELFRYYAARKPARRFYLFDRGDNALYDLGPAEQALGPQTPQGAQPIQKFGPGAANRSEPTRQ